MAVPLSPIFGTKLLPNKATVVINPIKMKQAAIVPPESQILCSVSDLLNAIELFASLEDGSIVPRQQQFHGKWF
jgi:hypothetical protein